MKIKPMETEVRKVGNKWGVFLKREFCKSDEPVLYGVSVDKEAAHISSKRFNENAHNDASWRQQEKERKASEKALRNVEE